MLSANQIEAYRRDGYVIARQLFENDVIAGMAAVARTDSAIAAHSVSRNDGEGGTTRLSLWRDLGNDVFGLVARSESLVHGAQACLGEEPYHLHTKIIHKEARSGGAWPWHQDYGYWYRDNILAPNLLSVYVALDPATRENGCMQVLKGSHLLGRLDHVSTGDHQGADLERVNAATRTHELVHCEMNPGDALFFHCNVLHRSDSNRSDRDRLALICCYNAASNSPFGPSPHPAYAKIETVPDGALKTGSGPSTDRERAYLRQ